ncbi:MAG: 2-dehydropantoate 2-reductase [Hyphomicrobiales bacterium]|nr:2-dehydropantoate 2-reductase [Hyphomicrobiales bacterium]
MRIAVMGAGAIGCYFGGRLAAAGEEVHFIARGAQLAALREKGLRIFSPHGDDYLPKVMTAAHPREVGPVDIVLFCVKLWDTDAGAELIKPMLRDDTGVYSFQNGIYAERRLAELLGPQHIIGGYAATPATLIEPGVVRQFGQWCTLEFGEMDNRRTSRVERLLEACLRAKIDALIADDIEAALWSKFIFISVHSGATSLCRATEGPIRSDPWGRQLLRALAEEGTAVAQAKRIAIPADFPDYVMEQIDGLPPDAEGSMYTDLKRGARLELEWLNGLMVKLAEETGLPAHAHRAVMQGLNLHAAGSAART